ncbi:MAG TPA: M13 family metallopeptidase [Polyangiaceae bacterium]
MLRITRHHACTFVILLGFIAAPMFAACAQQPQSAAGPPQPSPSATTATSASAGPPAASDAEVGLKLARRDLSLAPGNDFYGYANGSWQRSYQLKADEMSYGAFVELHYRSEDWVKAIIDELTKQAPAAGSIEQKVADYFKSFMALEDLNKRGIAPLQSELDAIKRIQKLDEVIVAFGKNGTTGTLAPLDLSIEIDRGDPDRSMLNVAHSGLGLPDRDYYLEAQFEKIRAAYQANIETMLKLAGYADSAAADAGKQILELETAIARQSWPKSELRQDDKTYNVMKLGDFEKKYASYPWRKQLTAAGIDLRQVRELNVVTPSALEPIALIVKQTPVGVWKSYLTYHLVKAHASLLGDRIDAANFAFFGTILGGQPEQRDRWKRAVNLVGDERALGEAVGKLWVDRHFPPAAKQQMLDLVANLRAAYGTRLQQLDWMSDVTKREALAKLQTFNPKIGYPDKWRDFSAIKIAPNDLMANYRAVRRYWYADQLSRLGKPTDRSEWFMTPQTVNAYYNPQFNEIVFPAAILQPPFFDPRADAAINYGAIGAVIGHEMGHGFDDQGSRYDAKGVQRNWWTDSDRQRFDAKTQALVGQYAQFEPLPGQKVNGELTLGENIGDLGGLSVAYGAYQLALAGKPAPVLGGYSGDQRFFLSWAQVWCSKYREQLQQQLLKVDPHSPPRFRVNGVVRNMDAWYTAFGVGPAQQLFLPPERRVRIW